MKLTIIEDDGKQRIAKDAEGNLYADAKNDEKKVVEWKRIEEYTISYPDGSIVPWSPVTTDG